MSYSKIFRFPSGQLELQQNGKTKVIPIEIADNPILWHHGLMNRKDMPLEYGMFYIFPKDTVNGFWMVGVPIPLDVAFIVSDKKIINIQTMLPCMYNCPIYYSPEPYRYALETKAGFFKMFEFHEESEINYRYNQK